MAAHRNHLTNVILPAKNKKDADDDIPEDLRSELKIHFVERIEEALSLALEGELDQQFLNQEVLPFLKAKL
jgi:ATP-dependent Lon protease